MIFQTRAADLRFSIYITAHSVNALPADQEGRQQAVDRLRELGVDRVILESYRSGLVVPVEKLRQARDFFQAQGFRVMGGIATVPGKDFGVRQNEKLDWLNWQNPKTRQDLEKVMRSTAPLFDEYVIDDFLCSGDTSPESQAARQDRSWSQYRMDLLSEVAQQVLIRPAKEAHPGIRVIIKYPQWYDRFHLFGYDVVRKPARFDQVWVGTETRGQYTQRYGFVQPYEGFVGFRWMRSLAGDKLTSAWFDHGDCEGIDFVEQAYQTVLGGAEEIVIFHYGDVLGRHPGGALLTRSTPELKRLAAAVRKDPVRGIPSYKPPHSDAGSDLYLMDYLGMLGIPLIPTARFPEKENVIFLPTQAAADRNVFERLQSAVRSRAIVILTTGFLAQAEKGPQIASWAGVRLPARPAPVRATRVYLGRQAVEVPHGLDLAMEIQPGPAKALLVARAGEKEIPFLLEHESQGTKFYVLNGKTFSQEDFDAVGEVLLCPRELGLLEIPEAWSNTVRRIFHQKLGIDMEGPARVTMQPLGNASLFLCNYNRAPASLRLSGPGAAGLAPASDPGEGILFEKETGTVRLPPRSHLWLNRQRP